MLEWITVDRANSAAGNEFVLARHDDQWVVRVDGRMLMSSKMHDSEIALAELAMARVDPPESVLVGGLGLGYTLRAVLDLGKNLRVTVCELLPELVGWNRTHLASLHGSALDDPRVDVVIGDVHDTIRRARGTFDVILLDVDNGPIALSQAKNQRLYSESGVRACYEALRPGGALAVWSVGTNAKYERKLAAAGFKDVETCRVAARVGSRAKHVVFLGSRP